MEPQSNIIAIQGIIEEDSEWTENKVFYDAEVQMIQGFPYISHVDYYNHADFTRCNVSDKLAQDINLDIKNQLGYFQSST